MKYYFKVYNINIFYFSYHFKDIPVIDPLILL